MAAPISWVIIELFISGSIIIGLKIGFGADSIFLILYLCDIFIKKILNNKFD